MATQQASTVLVVDDQLANRFLIRNCLEPRYRVIEASSGGDALELLQREPVDLVLLDVMMPGQSGIEVCRVIKKAERARFLPVIILTALSAQSDRNEALEAGADDFLNKPLDRRELQLRVAALLRTREQQSQIQSQLEALRSLEKAKEDLFSLIIHDLRNPLGAMFAYLEMLEEDLKDTAWAADAREAMSAAMQVRELLDETLKVRLLEEGALAIARAPVELQELLGGALASLRVVARRRSIELESEISGEPCVQIDAKLVRRALDNLLSNALKYSPPGSTISVRVQHAEAAVQISVSDQGPGIPDEMKSRMFEKFGSIEANNGQERKGIGLGLYLVKLVAQAHGGSIVVTDRPGGGSTFVMTLPAGLGQSAERATP